MVEVVLFNVEKDTLYGSLDTKKLEYCNPPMGLAFIASVLEKNGCSVKLVDLQLTNKPTEKAKDILKEENPKFVGITCTTPIFTEVCKLADLVKEVNKKTKVIVGGPHPTVLHEEVLKNESIDFVIIGEGEETLLELVKGHDFKKIRGLAYRQNRKVRINNSRPLIKDLDKIPFPAYHQLDLKRYGEPYKPNAVSIIGSRGCPYKCIFCANNIVHKKVRVRSPKNIVDEIEYLCNKHNIKSFSFFDEVFTLYRHRCIKICNEILKRKLKINWYCASRVDSVDATLLTIMKKAGCETIDYGIESGNQKTLDLIKKGITLAQVETVVNMTRKIGLQPNGLFMLGNPYETESTLQETINLAKKLPLEHAIFNITMPLPGTELWDFADKEKGIKFLTKDLGKFKAYEKPVIELPRVSSERLSQLQKNAYKSFYFRPNYIIKRIINDPLSLFNDVKKIFVMLKFVARKN